MMGGDTFQEPERKLAAILVADVVGFSRMMGADEVGTLARFDAARRQVVDPAIAAHRGRVFKMMGDSLFVEFGSVVQALRAAVAIQDGLVSHSAAFQPHNRIVLRIGIHQGDVVVQGTDLLGDGVNVATRLEAMSPPGGMCMSARVREDAAGKIALTVEDGGERTLRNIAQPMRVFIVRPAPPAGPSVPILAEPARLLLAAAPFGSAGAEAAPALAASLMERLVPALSQRPGLLAAPLAAGAPDLLAAARAIGAAFLLRGAVRLDPSGRTVQVAIRVVDVGSGQVAWSGKEELGREEAAQEGWPERVAAALAARLRHEAPDEDERTLVAALPAPREHRLLLIQSAPNGPPEGHAVPLSPMALVIGRTAPSDLVLPSGEVSRTHCQVDLAGSGVTVTDLRSTNGTFVNDERVAGPMRLRAGDVLRLGPYRLRYLADAAPAEAGLTAEELAAAGGDPDGTRPLGA